MTSEPFTPLVELLPSNKSVADALQRFWDMPYCCVLESALTVPRLGRFSFLVADPVQCIQISKPTADPLRSVAVWLEQFQTQLVPDLPPFQGGAVGLLGYELGGCFERLPLPMHNEFDLPLAVIGLYDVVLAWDHQTNQTWIISQGLPETNLGARRNRAEMRLRAFSDRLHGPVRQRSNFQSSVHATAHGLTAPQFDTRLGSAWLGNFDSQGYRAAIQQALEYIAAGDIFQVNLAQRLLRRANCHAVDLYLHLREVNAAPFAGYFDFGTAQIVSASPERFLQVQHGIIETRPIKGTRRRPGNPEHDKMLGKELLGSEKDLAENTMIVDLLRNDLSRVCDVNSLRIPQLCALESYPYVLHLVSSIEAKLRPDVPLIDLVAATFPGGSITGAPKIRAMEIIAELEPTVRGPYCGCLGYLGLAGNADWNILIRTITSSRGWWQVQVGGGITTESHPESEEEETWIKAAGLVAAIDRAASGTRSRTL